MTRDIWQSGDRPMTGTGSMFGLRPRLTSNLRRVFTPKESIGTLFYLLIAARSASNALDGPTPFEPPKGVCC